MEAHVKALKLIETISSSDIEIAKTLRFSLIDLLDKTRNTNGNAVYINKHSFNVLKDAIEVTIQFGNYHNYNMQTVILNLNDFIKHLHFNGDATIINQDNSRVDVEETIESLKMVDISQYIDDICNGRVNYKSVKFKTN